ncbi:MAG: UvrB/UvrC motif-containing protein, partial [Oscillospiraceae bacterium]|nr:UvrB/UvrC motif-containing protein [Oscillospiraceae bacterium]
YNVFEQRIDPILKRLHGNNNYVGRKAKKLSSKNDIPKAKPKTDEKIEQLKEELKQKIKEEKYEDAAKIRDEIKKLEK